MDRDYAGNTMPEVSPSSNIDEPIIPMSEIGATVPEGARFGSFIQTAQAAIRKGVVSIELSTGMGGGQEPAGAESYGKEARETIREIARANETTITSVHTPVQIGNMSGFNPQQGSFNDEHRHMEIDEVKKAIKFAADTAQGGSVVIHTGEFQRTMFDADWNKDGLFEAHPDESTKAVKHLVDTRTGRVITEVRLNQIVPQARWKRAEKNDRDSHGNIVRKGDYVDYENNKVGISDRVPQLNERGEVIIDEKQFDDFKIEADERNKELEMEKGAPLTPEEVVTPEEAFLHATTQTQEKIARGYALYYGRGIEENMKAITQLRESYKHYRKVEGIVPKNELDRMKREIGKIGGAVGEFVDLSEKKLPSEIISDAIKNMEKSLEQEREMMTGQLQSAREQKLLREHAKSAWKYAKEKTTDSYAEAGIFAMEQSLNNPYVNRDVFLAPENIFPEMGYGSHPDELIELVKNGRKEMAKRLVKDYGYEQQKAKDMSKRFIKATFDTQHLGMWWKNFKENKKGEKYEERKERFDKWYLQKVEDMQQAGIIGNIHLVDSMGGGHHHLPAGQGDLPVKKAIQNLKKLGYNGIINSEGHEEESRFGQGRMVIETWKEFGSPLFTKSGYFGGAGRGGAPQAWSDVSGAYFGRTYPPKFIFGAYSPSQEWRLWSDVPME